MKRISTQRRSLVKAIDKFLPGRLFSQWKLTSKVKWSPHRLVYVAVLMTWSADQTLIERFHSVRGLLRGLFAKWRLGTSYQGWCDAQRLWLKKVQPVIGKRLRQQMREFSGRYWTREGWRALAVDGSRVECPRTSKNKEELGCAGKEKTGPQLLLTTLWHMGLGLPWDYRIGPGTDSERRHLEDMLADLPAQSLLVADAGFTGFDMLHRITESGRRFLVRVGSNVHLLQKLGYTEMEGKSMVYLWPEAKRTKAPQVLRLIKVTHGKKSMYLLTNELEENRLPKKQAAVLYEMRWGVEIFYRSAKQTMNRRRMLSRTPETCKAELHWVMIGIWLLGMMSVSGIIGKGGDPLSWSVALSRKHVRSAMGSGNGRHKRKPLLEQLSQAVQDTYQRNGNKKAQDWPHKKRESPPGDPKIRLAEQAEIVKAQRLKKKQAA